MLEDYFNETGDRGILDELNTAANSKGEPPEFSKKVLDSFSDRARAYLIGFSIKRDVLIYSDMARTTLTKMPARPLPTDASFVECVWFNGAMHTWQSAGGEDWINYGQALCILPATANPLPAVSSMACIHARDDHRDDDAQQCAYDGHASPKLIHAANGDRILEYTEGGKLFHETMPQ
jgi:hypothetical protein